MKSIIIPVLFGLAILVAFGASTSSDHQNRPAILTVVSSKADEVVTFAAAYVSGDSSATSSLDYSILKTPFRLEIPSPYFFGIFKKVSGDADVIVLIKAPGGKVQASSSVVLITKEDDRLKSQGF